MVLTRNQVGFENLGSSSSYDSQEWIASIGRRCHQLLPLLGEERREH